MRKVRLIHGAQAGAVVEQGDAEAQSNVAAGTAAYVDAADQAAADQARTGAPAPAGNTGSTAPRRPRKTAGKTAGKGRR